MNSVQDPPIDSPPQADYTTRPSKLRRFSAHVDLGGVCIGHVTRVRRGVWATQRRACGHVVGQAGGADDAIRELLRRQREQVPCPRCQAVARKATHA